MNEYLDLLARVRNTDSYDIEEVEDPSTGSTGWAVYGYDVNGDQTYESALFSEYEDATGHLNAL